MRSSSEVAVPPVFLQESEEEEKVEEDPIFTGEFYKDLVRFLSKMDPLQEVMDNLELMPFPSEKPEAAEARGLKFVLNAERQVPVCKWLLGEQDGEARRHCNVLDSNRKACSAEDLEEAVDFVGGLR